MKTINIQKKAQQQNSKEFRIGNGRIIKCSSKREVIYFIAETNRFLTKVLVICNQTYCSVMLQYRSMWLVTTNVNNGNRTNYLTMQQSIKSNLHAAEELMDKFNFTTSGSNDPFFSFIDLKKVALFIGQAAKELEAFNNARNLTASKYECQAFYERCLLIAEKLNDYNYVK